MYQENVTLQSTGDVKEFWSPSIHCGASTPPLQTLDSSIPTSIPHTPITQVNVFQLCNYFNKSDLP